MSLQMREYRLFIFSVRLMVEIRVQTAHDSSEPTGHFSQEEKEINIVAHTREQAALWMRERYKNVQILNEIDEPIDAVILNLTH